MGSVAAVPGETAAGARAYVQALLADGRPGPLPERRRPPPHGPNRSAFQHTAEQAAAVARERLGALVVHESPGSASEAVNLLDEPPDGMEFFTEVPPGDVMEVEDAVNDGDSHESVELDRREPERGKAESEWGTLDWGESDREEAKVVHVATWTRRQS